MAAAAAGIRNALARLGFTAEAALYITQVQGIDDLDEMGMLTDSEVENLCKVTQRLGV